MTKNSEEALLGLIDSARKIGLITHQDGDGDAFGSMLGLKRVLETIGKEVVIFSNEPLEPTFDFLADEINYRPQSGYEPIDLLIGVDANSESRFTIPTVFEEARKNRVKVAVLDHHLPSDIKERVDCYLCDSEASSASEMVYRLVKKLNLRLDKTTATVILLGIETDTFSLQFENSKPAVFLAFADLLSQGARLKPIVESAFGGKPIPMVKLLGRVMERVRLTDDGIAVSYVTLSDKKEFNLPEKASSGVANFLDQIKEAKVIMVFEQVEENLVKVSLRSNGSEADVARLASYFGGGGHKKAAGFSFEGDLRAIIPNIAQ